MQVSAPFSSSATACCMGALNGGDEMRNQFAGWISEKYKIQTVTGNRLCIATCK